VDESAPTPREVVLRVMVMVTLADGDVGDDEITRIRWVVGRLGPGRPVAEAEVRAMVERVALEGIDLHDYLRSVARFLRDEDKRTTLTAAFIVACADGRVVDEEDAMLVLIGRALNISPATYRATLRHMDMVRKL